MRFHYPLAAFAFLALATPAGAQSNSSAPPQSQVQANAPAQTDAAGSTHSNRHGRRSLDERFAEANTTHDGHLTLDQAKSGRLKAVARHFDAIDKDHKGFVTEADVHAYYKEQRAARHHAKGDTASTKS